MKNIGFLLLICLLSSCQNGSNNEAFEASYGGDESDYYQEENQPSDKLQTNDRKIIKTAEVRFQVENLNTSTKKIENLTEKYSGFIVNMNQTNSNYAINNSLTIRIPSEKLDDFIAEVEKESIYTNYKRFSSKDVTEEFVDITTRLATKKEVRDRYIEILRNKAKTVQDILEAEEKIRIIQEEIESAEGRLKYLNNQTSLSTINIELYQEVAYVSPPQINKKPYLTKIKEGFSNGWNLILNIIIGLITIWPIILLIVLLILFRKNFNFFTRNKS